MLESRKSTSPRAVRTAALVGFTPLERAGLALLLAEHQVSLVDVVEELGHYRPDVAADNVLVDLATATRDTGVREPLHHAMRHFRAQHPHTSVFGIYQSSTRLDLAPDDVAMFDALFDADTRPETLLAMIGGTGTARRPWRKPTISIAPLTSREQEILRLIAGGSTSRNVAESLGISVHTVDSHKQRMFRRLGVQNQAQAVSVALRLGLLDACTQQRGAAS